MVFREKNIYIEMKRVIITESERRCDEMERTIITESDGRSDEMKKLCDSVGLYKSKFAIMKNKR